VATGRKTGRLYVMDATAIAKNADYTYSGVQN